jgi:hypothetical protein
MLLTKFSSHSRVRAFSVSICLFVSNSNTLCPQMHTHTHTHTHTRPDLHSQAYLHCMHDLPADGDVGAQKAEVHARLLRLHKLHARRARGPRTHTEALRAADNL